MAVENFNRFKIRLVVSLSPGIHLRGLQRLVGTSFNTVRHHVHAMVRAGEISCEKEGGFSRLYPGAGVGNDRPLYSMLNNKTTRAILRALGENGSMSHKQLCDTTRLAKSTISEHADTLLGMGIIRKVHSLDGRQVYELNDPDILEALRRSETLFRATVDSFIELWDF